MKKVITMILIIGLITWLFTGCGGGLTTKGCTVISQDGDYVTYQQVCGNCGYKYGDPVTAHVAHKLAYSLTCTSCGEVIYISIERN